MTACKWVAPNRIHSLYMALNNNTILNEYVLTSKKQQNLTSNFRRHNKIYLSKTAYMVKHKENRKEIM